MKIEKIPILNKKVFFETNNNSNKKWVGTFGVFYSTKLVFWTNSFYSSVLTSRLTYNFIKYVNKFFQNFVIIELLFYYCSILCT